MQSEHRAEGKLSLRVAGALQGNVFLDDLGASVGALKYEIARLMGAGTDPSSLKLLVGGRHLQDDQASLAAAGVTPMSKILVVGKGGPGVTSEMAALEAKQNHLSKIRQALERISKRDAQVDDNALDLYNQNGQKVPLKAEDKQAAVMGLALHERGKLLLSKGKLSDALEALLMAEESFTLASPQLLEFVDNYGMLLLDTVWCCYKLQDIRRLAVAQRKLQGARKALAAAHGPNLERVRRIHGTGFCPEIATYLRLEVLEGVVAFYNGEHAEADKMLGRAFNKWLSLQVSDEQLAQLQDMGHSLQESKRALRFSGGNLTAALDFIQSQRKQEQEKKEQQRRDAAWQKERKRYGKTAEGHYVDGEFHKRLVGLGYDSLLSGEALRGSNNDFNAALDALLNPGKRAGLTLAVSLREATAAQEKDERKGEEHQGEGQQGEEEGYSSMSEGEGEQQGQGQRISEEEAELRRMEDDVLEGLHQSGGNAAQDYDLEVEEEGEIIDTYRTLCRTALGLQ